VATPVVVPPGHHRDTWHANGSNTAKRLLEKSELLKGLMQGKDPFPALSRRQSDECLDVPDDTGPIPLNNVAMNVLKKVNMISHPVFRHTGSWVLFLQVLEWCDYHKEDPVEEKEDDSRNKKSTDIDEWDQKFMQVDQEMLFEIILVPSIVCRNGLISSQAANYLDIKPLLDTGCKTVANMIKGKSPEEIRKTFNITNDFTYPLVTFYKPYLPLGLMRKPRSGRRMNGPRTDR